MILSGSRKVVPAALAAVLLAGGPHAVAETWQINNKLSVDMTDGKVVNRQDYKIKTHPPTTIAAGDTGEFEAYIGDSPKVAHLKVQYTVGTETIAFGIRDKYDNPDFRCFTDTPSDISGSHDGCNSQGTITFTFSPAQ